MTEIPLIKRKKIDPPDGVEFSCVCEGGSLFPRRAIDLDEALCSLKADESLLSEEVRRILHDIDETCNPEDAAVLERMRAELIDASLARIEPQVHNIVVTGMTTCELQPQHLMRSMIRAGIQWSPQKIIAQILRFKNPKVTILLFRNKKVTCMGARNGRMISAGICYLMDALRRIGYPTSLERVRFENIVASASIGQYVKMRDLAFFDSNLITYDPEQFPGAIMRVSFDRHKVAVIVFETGNIVIIGSKRRTHLMYALLYALNIIQRFIMTPSEAEQHVAALERAAAPSVKAPKGQAKARGGGRRSKTSKKPAPITPAEAIEAAKAAQKFANLFAPQLGIEVGDDAAGVGGGFDVDAVATGAAEDDMNDFEKNPELVRQLQLELEALDAEDEEDEDEEDGEQGDDDGDGYDEI